MRNTLSVLFVICSLSTLYFSSCQNHKAETLLGSNACDTSNVTFSQTIAPWVATQCANCHGGSSPSAGIGLETYTEIKACVDNQSFGGSINHQAGYSPMPKGTSKTESCMLSKINRWINQGAPNN